MTLRTPGRETDLDIKRWLNDTVSPSFCMAKWRNATIWLGSGMTTSCHHPPAHKIDIKELATNPAAIHNTQQKKQALRHWCLRLWKNATSNRKDIFLNIYPL